MAGFEEKLKRLEEIANSMRQEGIELSDASKLFQEGIGLAQKLEKELAKVEASVEQLINANPDEDEKPILELFPELDQDT
jgi:exodeoxyribonuclease VII small subunit